jgi:hypothetical protein
MDLKQKKELFRSSSNVKGNIVRLRHRKEYILPLALLTLLRCYYEKKTWHSAYASIFK